MKNGKARTFWRRNRYMIGICALIVLALLLFVFYGIPYYNKCAELGGFIMGGKSALCWTPNGPLWPWQIWS